MNYDHNKLIKTENSMCTNEITMENELKLIKAMYPEVKDENILMQVLNKYKFNNINLSISNVWAIVGYENKKNNSFHYEIQDTLLFHTMMASRHKAYAGYDIEYGPFVEKTYNAYIPKYQTYQTYDKVSLKVPEWVKVTIKKRSLLDPQFIDFFPTPIILWDEHYGTLNNQTKYPSKFWVVMSLYMLVKVALSTGLRLAFPESCTGYTYEELMGKKYFDNENDYENNIENSNSVSVTANENFLHEKETFLLDDNKYSLEDVLSLVNEKMELAYDELNINPASNSFELWSHRNKNEIIKWKKATIKNHDIYSQAKTLWKNFEDNFPLAQKAALERLNL